MWYRSTVIMDIQFSFAVVSFVLFFFLSFIVSYPLLSDPWLSFLFSLVSSITVIGISIITLTFGVLLLKRRLNDESGRADKEVSTVS